MSRQRDYTTKYSPTKTDFVEVTRSYQMCAGYVVTWLEDTVEKYYDDKQHNDSNYLRKEEQLQCVNYRGI